MKITPIVCSHCEKHKGVSKVSFDDKVYVLMCDDCITIMKHFAEASQESEVNNDDE